MKEDTKLQGLCKECTHRNSCANAKRHLYTTACSTYRHWKKNTKSLEVKNLESTRKFNADLIGK